MYYYIVTNLQELLVKGTHRKPGQPDNKEEPLSLYQVQGNGTSQDKQHCVYRAFKLCLHECIPTTPMPFPTLITKYTKVQVTNRTMKAARHAGG